MSKCAGEYQDYATREWYSCDEAAEPDSLFCAECAPEPEDDPDWAWNVRHEW